MAPLRFAAFVFWLIAAIVNAHENEKEQAGDAEPPYTVTPVFKQAMSFPAWQAAKC